MSVIAEAFKADKEIFALVEVDFDGWTKRWTDGAGGVSVSGRFFEGSILSIGEIRFGLDLRALRAPVMSVDVTIANKERFQDNETHRKLDSGTGSIWFWSKSLSWDDIQPYPVFKGRFQSLGHNKYQYRFSLVDLASTKLPTIPTLRFSTDIWSACNTEIIGNFVPIVFGAWDIKIPLHRVSSANDQYLATLGQSAQESAPTVKDKDDNVVSGTPPDWYPGRLDYGGNFCAVIDYSYDLEALEPLYCNCDGTKDSSGDITGVKSALIERPADIVHYLLSRFSNLGAGDISAASFRTINAIIPRLVFASYFRAEGDLLDIVDRILAEALCFRTKANGKIGAAAINFNPFAIGRMRKYNLLGRSVRMDKTPADYIQNNLLIRYGYNPHTYEWDEELSINRTNSGVCERSCLDYGEQPLKTIRLTDVQDDDVAKECSDRYLGLFAFRHDLATSRVPIWDGWDTSQGDAGVLTVEEGSSPDGAGWQDEPCILIEKTILPANRTIEQVWLRLATG